MLQVVRLERVTAGYVVMCSRRDFLQENLKETLEAKKAQAKVLVPGVTFRLSRGAVTLCAHCPSPVCVVFRSLSLPILLSVGVQKLLNRNSLNVSLPVERDMFA